MEILSEEAIDRLYRIAKDIDAPNVIAMIDEVRQHRKFRESLGKISPEVAKAVELAVATKDAAQWRDDDSPQSETTFGCHKQELISSGNG